MLGALGIAVVAIGPWRTEAKSKVRGWLDDARRVVQPHYSKVTPTRITASSALKNDPPQNAFDGIIETFWAEGGHGDGTGQSLTVTFAKPTDLARVGFTMGDQKTPAELRDAAGAAHARARLLRRRRRGRQARAGLARADAQVPEARRGREVASRAS